MFDPDKPLVLRLVDTPASKPDAPAAQPEKQIHRLFDGFMKPASFEEAAQRLTATEHAMEEAIKAWSAAYVDWTALRAQARPVTASRPVGDGAMRYEQPQSLVFRADGTVEPL